MAKKKTAKKQKPTTQPDEPVTAADSPTPITKKKGGGGGGARKKLGKNTVVFFMGHLVAAGAVDEIPEKSGDQGRLAQRIRQMAEKLTRQALRFGDGDIALGGDDAGESEEDDTED